MDKKNNPSYFDQADEFTLTRDERAAGRLALQARMSLSLTADELADGRRALQGAMYAEPAPGSVWSVFTMPLRLPALALAVLLLLGASGGGLAYAAESAVPGDVLYGVKIYVNEAVYARFQLTPEDRVRWAIARLHRRMDELRTLEARGAAEEQIDVAIGDTMEETAHDVEFEVEALPAAAAERAAARTAVNAAIGDDDDSLRRASRINRVLKALKERADTFDLPPGQAGVPPPSVIAPVPSVDARARSRTEASASAAVRGDAGDDRSSERREERGGPSSAGSADDRPLPTIETPEVDLDVEGSLDGAVDVRL